MDLPINPPVEPMLATAVKDIPVAPGMTYEPKWDGFRCVVFRDGDEVELASRGGKTLTRYFPEVVAQVREQFPPRCVVDGEIVIIRRDAGATPRLDFELLQLRIHPAASRVNLLAAETPADFIAFDLLALGDESLVDKQYGSRRTALVSAFAGATAPVHVTPTTTDLATAREWFEVFEGAGLDGLIAKPSQIPYTPGKRLMYKVKHARTADCVVAGFRWHKSGPIVGSLLLGLFNEDGQLQHVGVSASFTAVRRKELLDELAPYRENALDNHPWRSWAEAEAQAQASGKRMPGAVSRWSAGKTLEWEPLRPELVVEVAYDAMEGDRFRHTARFVRWRTDRTPESCTYEQLERPIRFDVDDVLGGTSVDASP